MNVWRVSIDVATDVAVTRAQADVVVDRLKRYGAVLGYQPVAMSGVRESDAAVVYDEKRLSITLTVQTSSANPLRAGELGGQMVARAVAAAGAGIATWLGIETLMDGEADRRLAAPPIPSLVGAAEAGQLLGVSRQREHQLRHREDFPAPVVELGGGPLWTQMSIEAFDESRNRTPGRLPAPASTPEASDSSSSRRGGG